MDSGGLIEISKEPHSVGDNADNDDEVDDDAGDDNAQHEAGYDISSQNRDIQRTSFSR